MYVGEGCNFPNPLAHGLARFRLLNAGPRSRFSAYTMAMEPGALTRSSVVTSMLAAVQSAQTHSCGAPAVPQVIQDGIW